jgi:probable HAF family extracellular repeat protein
MTARHVIMRRPAVRDIGVAVRSRRDLEKPNESEGAPALHPAARMNRSFVAAITCSAALGCGPNALSPSDGGASDHPGREAFDHPAEQAPDHPAEQAPDHPAGPIVDVAPARLPSPSGLDGKPGLLLLAPKDPTDASGATLVSADGKVVVGRIAWEQIFHNTQELTTPFIWSAERGVEKMGGFVGPEAVTVAKAISADGTTVLGSPAFKWTTAGYAPFAGFDWVAAASGDLTVVVGWLGSKPLRGANGTTMPLVDPTTPEVTLYPSAISADGTTIVGGMDSHPFLWKASGVTKLPNVANASRGEARDVSANGAVVVGFSYDDPSTPHAFRWTAAGGSKEIGLFMPTACSADASVVVGQTLSGPQGPGGTWVWDEAHGARALETALSSAGVDLAGTKLDLLTDISADGRVVVGQARLTNEKTMAFRAVLPEANSCVGSPKSICSRISTTCGATYLVCDDVLRPQICDRGTWRCPDLHVEYNQCGYSGAIPPGCGCTPEGVRCTDGGADSGLDGSSGG